MNYDELAATVRDQAATLTAAHEEAEHLRRELDWVDSVNPQALSDAVTEAERITTELGTVGRDLTSAKYELVARRVLMFAGMYKHLMATSIVDDWPGKAKQAKTRVAELRTILAELEAQSNATRSTLRERQKEAKRHASFDRAAAADRLLQLNAILADRSEHEERVVRLTSIDRELEPHLARLVEVERDLRSVGSRSSRADSYAV